MITGYEGEFFALAYLVFIKPDISLVNTQRLISNAATWIKRHRAPSMSRKYTPKPQKSMGTVQNVWTKDALYAICDSVNP